MFSCSAARGRQEPAEDAAESARYRADKTLVEQQAAGNAADRHTAKCAEYCSHLFSFLAIFF